MKTKLQRFVLVGAIIFACAGIPSVSLGILGLVGERQDLPTLQTTAVVDRLEVRKGEEWDVIHETWREYEEFWVYLDFRNSPMAPELIALLTRQPQGVELSHEGFNQFYVGKPVTVVYRHLRLGHTLFGEVAIESLDGYEVWDASGDLTTLRIKKSVHIVLIVVGGILLATSVPLFIVSSKPEERKRVWTFVLRDGTHSVELLHGYLSGKREITVDGITMIFPSQLVDYGSEHTFQVSGIPCHLVIKSSFRGFKYELYVDGELVRGHKVSRGKST